MSVGVLRLMFAGNESTASVALGAVSLSCVSILNADGFLLGWSKRQEGSPHLPASSIQDSTASSRSRTGVPRAERQQPTELLRCVREQYDRNSKKSVHSSPRPSAHPSSSLRFGIT